MVCGDMQVHVWCVYGVCGVCVSYMRVVYVCVWCTYGVRDVDV